MMYFVYILFSPSRDRFYTGSCDDLKKRVHRHNASRVSSTKHGVPWELVWSRTLDTRRLARLMEQRIKKRGAKRFLESLSEEE